jgi:hypothetical protein
MRGFFSLVRTMNFTLNPLTAITPNRQTSATFDLDNHPFLTEQSWGGLRLSTRIASAISGDRGGDSQYHKRVHLWATGAWTLRPLQMHLSDVQERATTVPYVFLPVPGIGDSQPNVLKLTTAIPVLPKHKFKTPTTGTNTQDGDVFWVRSIVDTQLDYQKEVGFPSWVGDLKTEINDEVALIEPLRVIARTTTTQRADQGFCLRWQFFATKQTNPDIIGVFCFGQYAIAIGGNGFAHLWERALLQNDTLVWKRRRSFRYCQPGGAVTIGHSLIIFPHMGPQGQRYIAFHVANVGKTADPNSGSSSIGNIGTASFKATSEDIFRWDEAHMGTKNRADQTNVTTSENIFLMEREKIRCEWQISHLNYYPTGKLIDLPWASDQFPTSRQYFINVIKRNNNGNITSQINEAWLGLVPDFDIKNPAVEFNFTSATNGTDTPLLWGYKINRQPIFNQSPANISFTTPVLETKIEIGEDDPRHEQASVTINDPTDAFPRLRNRGELTFRIQTTYKPLTGIGAGQTFKVVLFRGYALRPSRKKKGKADQTQGFWSNKPRIYPSAEWSIYQISAAGMWYQLMHRTSRNFSFQNFAFDQFAALNGEGNQVPWKVTDVIVELLRMAGFPSSMIGIIDLPIRLFPGVGAEESDRVFNPSTSIGSQVIRLAKAYLGMFLTFDVNSGTVGADLYPVGQWKLVGPPPIGALPVANFVTGPPAGASTPGVNMINVFRYPIGTYQIIGEPERYVEPPENNHVWAFTLAGAEGGHAYKIDNHVYNPISYPVPGMTPQTDRESPHFLGYEKMLTYGCPAMWGGAQIGGYQQTQEIVNFILLRLFTFTCLARRVIHFYAPLVMIQSNNIAGLQFRIPRFYDLVTYNGQIGWYIRSCTPDYNNDRAQMAHYAIETIVSYK